MTNPGSKQSTPALAGSERTARASTVPVTPQTSPFAIGLLMRQAHEQFSDAMDEVLQPFGLERRHLMVLMRLEHEGPLTQRDLVVKTHHDKSSVVRIVDDLERLDLAVREPVAGDRRLRAVTLSGHGRDVLRQAAKVAGPAAAAAMQPLDEADVARLRGLLLRLTAG